MTKTLRALNFHHMPFHEARRLNLPDGAQISNKDGAATELYIKLIC